MDAPELTAWQMALRALIVYIAALAMVRLSDKRFIGKNTAFDVILGIVFGSVVSRAVTGNAPFFQTLVAGLVLVSLHWLFAACAFHSDFFGTLIKGHERTLVEDGKVQGTTCGKATSARMICSRRCGVTHISLIRAMYRTRALSAAARSA